MMVERGLLRILWRRALPATLLGMLGLVAYVLIWPALMTLKDPWPEMVVFVQCFFLAGLLGSFKSPAFAFIYSRGYSRDALWRHVMLISALSILVGWLPAALVVWSGLRSVIHDHLFQSPYFPVMAPFETYVSCVWLAVGVLLMPAFHYVWIRLVQPTKGGESGIGLATELFLALFLVFVTPNFLSGSMVWLAGASYGVVLVVLLLGGRVLHRSVEVRA